MEFIQRSLAGDYAAEALFFFFKVGDALLEPTLRIFIYETVCLNEYRTDEICDHLEHYPDHEIVVQDSTSRFMMYYKILINCPAMLIVLFCGAWSDKSGRKLPVLLTSMGTFVAVLLYAISCGWFGDIPYKPLIFIGAGVRGIFGRSAVMTMAAHSYVSDYTAPEQRTARLSGLVATSHFGYLLGSILAGVCLERIGFIMIFLIVMMLHTVIIILAYCCMRDETAFERTPAGNINRSRIEEAHREISGNLDFRSDERTSLTSSVNRQGGTEHRKIKFAPASLDSSTSRSQDERSGSVSSSYSAISAPRLPSLDDEIAAIITNIEHNEYRNQSSGNLYDSNSQESRDDAAAPDSPGFWRNMLSSFNVCRKPRRGAKSSILVALFFIIYLQQANKSGETDVLLLFSKRSPIHLSRAGYGYLLASIYASLGFFALIVPRILTRVGISIKDTSLAMIGSTFKILSLILLAVAREKWLLFLAYSLSGPHSLTISSAKSMISKLCHEEDLGKAFSILSSGETLANLMGTIFYTNIYSATLSIYPCVSFLVEMSLYCVIFIVLLQINIAMRRRRSERSNPEDSIDSNISTYGSVDESEGCHKAVSAYASP